MFLNIPNIVFAQSNYSSYGELYNQNGVKIELQIKPSTNPCGNNAKLSRFAIFITNAGDLKLLKRYLNWKMDITNCNGDVIAKSISIDLYQNNIQGLNKSTDWEFEGNLIENAFYEVSNTASPSLVKDKLKGKTFSVKADLISGKTEIVTGDLTTLTVEGGKLTPGASWVWYSGTCTNGIKIGAGKSIKVSPIRTTTYYVRAESNQNNTDCIAVTVTVDNNSKAPSAILGKSKICKTEALNDEKLTVTGGKLGLHAKWVWYENGCPTATNYTRIGEGETINIKPQKTTIYYVRAEGPTNNTDCVYFVVELGEQSTKGNKIKINGTGDNICEGEEISLENIGGNLSPDAKWVWYSQILGKKDRQFEGEGIILNTKPSISKTFFVHAEGICKNTEELSVVINVKQNSTKPNSITSIKGQGNHFNLKVNGGNLGENANWVWYKENCDGKRIGTGETIDIEVKKANKIFVKAEGKCNVSDCATLELRPSNPNSKFGFLNIGVVANEVTDISNGVLTIGFKSVYLRLKMGYKSSSGNSAYPGYECDDNQILNYPSNTGTYYQFNSKIYNKRTGYTLGYMFGGEVVKFYVGGGYGENKRFWGFKIYTDADVLKSEEWANNISQSVKGPEAETGVFVKLNHFNLMGGFSGIYDTETKRKYIDAHLGIGFSF